MPSISNSNAFVCWRRQHNKHFVNADFFKKGVGNPFAKTGILIFMVKPYINSSEPP